MTASPTSKVAVDGLQNQFPLGMSNETVSLNTVQATYLKEPVGETLVTPAQDGTDGTGITAPTGGLGIRGWLSGVYKALSNPLTVNMNGAQVTVIPTVTTGSTYSAGFCIGGIMTFAGLLSSVTPVAKLQSITLRFKATVQTTITLNVAIFSSSPAGTFNDHATAVVAAADSAILLGVYTMAVPKSVLGSSQTIYNLDGINKKLVGTSSSLFAVVTCGTAALTVNPVSTSEMSLTLAVDW